MDKLYNRTNWVDDNEPDINADNLNNIEKGIDDIDNRVVEVGNSVEQINSNLSDLAYGEKSGSVNLAKLDNSYNTNSNEWTYSSLTNNKVTGTRSTTFNCFFTTFVMEVENGKTYTISANTDRRVFGYKDKTWGTAISSLSNAALPKTFTADYTGLLVVGIYAAGVTSCSVENFMCVEGSSVLPYAEWVMSNKQLGMLNESLGAQGLLNKFDGVLSNGYWSNSFVLTPYADNVCNTNPIPCKENDDITFKFSRSATDGRIRFFNASNALIGSAIAFSGSEYRCKAPNGTAKVCFTVVGTGFTKDNLGKVSVYINNEIEQVKADLTTQRVTLMSSPLTVIGNKSGNVIQLTFANGNVNTQADTTILTIPEGWRPEYMVDFLDTYGKNRFTIGSDGKMVAKSAVNNNVRGSVVYLSV